MKISAGTDVGMVRQSNQDAYAGGKLPSGGFYAVVCDGMGGHAGGNVASTMAVDRISAELEKNSRSNMSISSIKNMIESAIVSANMDVFDESNSNDALQGMGTTAVVAVFFDNTCVVANVGDSRCYLISDGKISQVTKDHSLVQQMVDAGYITAQEAEHHPRKNIITRALGISDDIQVDFFDIEFSGDGKLLLCSDGLTNHVNNDDILAVLSEPDFDGCAQKLISLANENGGSDNITAVVVSE